MVGIQNEPDKSPTTISTGSSNEFGYNSCNALKTPTARLHEKKASIRGGFQQGIVKSFTQLFW